MADVNIYISYQDYSEAADGSQLNGWKANGFSEELTAKLKTITGGTDTGIIPADFKDHKTVFMVTAEAEAEVTFNAGDTYGARDVIVKAPEGTSLIWLDSTKFADKRSGEIKVTSDEDIQIVGYEMR